MNPMTSLSALSANMGAFGIIATILAIIATVAAFILVVPESKREKLGRFGKFLHDAVNFKFLIVEKILQALYIFVTAYLILYSVRLLHAVHGSGDLDRPSLAGRLRHPADGAGPHCGTSVL